MFCGAPLSGSPSRIGLEARVGAALLLGLALQGCPSTSVPLYGAPVTDLAEETAETGDTGSAR